MVGDKDNSFQLCKCYHGRQEDDIVDDDKNFVDDNKVIVATVPTKRKTYNLKNRNRNYVKYNVNDNADNDKDFTNVTNKQYFVKELRKEKQKISLERSKCSVMVDELTD